MTSLTIFTSITMGIILLVLVGAFIFITFFTRSWGFSWWTWLLALGTGSMRGGFKLIISFIAISLIIGYALGYMA